MFKLWGNKFNYLPHPIRKIDGKPIFLKELAILQSSTATIDLGHFLRKKLLILGVEHGIQSISADNFVACGVVGNMKKPEFVVILNGLENPGKIINKIEKVSNKF